MQLESLGVIADPAESGASAQASGRRRRRPALGKRDGYSAASHHHASRRGLAGASRPPIWRRKGPGDKPAADEDGSYDSFGASRAAERLSSRPFESLAQEGDRFDIGPATRAATPRESQRTPFQGHAGGQRRRDDWIAGSELLCSLVSASDRPTPIPMEPA